MDRIIAKDSFYAQYWFTDNGIIIFKTHARMVVFAAATIVCVLIANVVTALTASVLLGFFGLVVAYTVAYLLFRSAALRRLSSIARLSAQQASESPTATVIPWGTVEAVHISGDESFFRAMGKVTRLRLGNSPTDDIVQFMKFRMNRELIEVVPPHAVMSKFFLILLSVGGGLTALGVASLAFSNTITNFSLIMAGLSVLLDSSIVFGLQNPQFLRPIPSFVAYAGLGTFSLGLSLWLSTIDLGWSSDSNLPFLLFLCGGTVCGGIFGRVLRMRFRKY